MTTRLDEESTEPSDSTHGVPAPCAHTMRIALLTRARAGGELRVNVSLANLLKAEGRNVTVVMPKAAGSFLADLDPTVPLVDLGTTSHVKFFARLARYLRLHAHDCYVVTQHHIAAIAILASMLARSRARVIVVIQTNITQLLKRSRLSAFYSFLLRVLFTRIHDFVCVSEGVASDLGRYVRRPDTRIHLIHNPVSIPRITLLAEQPCSEPWLLDKALPVVLSVARLAPQKDIPCLLRAMAIVLRRRPARLLIAGDGPLKASLLDLAHDLGIASHVRFLGDVHNPFPLMKRADAMALSSAWEGFPLVLLEALALGLPIVATNSESGPAEILENGRFGRLVPVGDSVRLADALYETLSLPHDPGPGIQRAAELSEDRCLREYLRILEGVP